MAVTGARETSQQVVTDLFGPSVERNFEVRYWDGTSEPAGGGVHSAFTLVLRHPGALRRMLLPPTERALGEAFVRGDIDVEGDLESATALSQRIRRRLSAPATFIRIASQLRSLPCVPTPESARSRPGFRLRRRHSLQRDKDAIRFHYDMGNDFYRLFLDRGMIYSCAYFRTPDDDLDAAQEAKLEHICRKLDLRPGERLLDIGCGWGGLIEYASSRYGVDATGITLSEQQAAYARGRIANAGLDDRCRVHVLDYRALPLDARFDKIVSVGMVEHVGRRNLRRYFADTLRHLEPGGLFLNHGIVSLEAATSLRRSASRSLRRWTSFVERHVFPDGELVTAAELLQPAEAAGFELRDAENLREHYVLTLRHWVQRLETNGAAAVACGGQHAWRTWRLYLAASASAFATGRIAVTQLLLARPRADGTVRLPLTRNHLYIGHMGGPLPAQPQRHAAGEAFEIGVACDVAN